MYRIKCIEKNGTIVPETDIEMNENIKMIVCNGTDYLIYEEGDELPQVD